MVIKRFDVVMGCFEEGVYEEECDTGEYVRYDDHAAEVSRLEYELEKARTANTVHIADAELYREADVAKHETKIAIDERDAAIAEIDRMRPVVESAVRWLSDLTEYAELELERAARDYRDKEAKDADKG